MAQPAAGTETSTVPASDRIWTANFTYAALATFCFFIAFVLFFPTLPLFIDELGGGEALIGLLVGGSSIVSLTLRPFTGRLVDTQGRRRFLTLGALFMFGSSVGYDFVTGTALLWPVRLAAGAGISLYFTASMAYVADISPPSKRGQAMSSFGIFNNVAMAAGPALAIWLLNAGGLRSLEGHLERWLPGRGSDVGGDHHFAVVFVAAAIVAAMAVLLTRRVQDVHVPAPRPAQGLRQTFESMFSRPAVFPAVINFLVVVNFVALNIFIPLYNKRELHVGNIGLYYTVFAAAIMFSRIWGGPFLDRYPRAYTILPALAVMSAGTMANAFVQEPWMLFSSAAIIGSGSGISQPGLQAMVVDRAQGKNLGAAASTFAIGLDIGLAGGGAFMGLVLKLTDWPTFFIVSGSFTAAATVILAAAVLRERRLALANAPVAAGS